MSPFPESVRPSPAVRPPEPPRTAGFLTDRQRATTDIVKAAAVSVTAGLAAVALFRSFR